MIVRVPIRTNLMKKAVERVNVDVESHNAGMETVFTAQKLTQLDVQHVHVSAPKHLSYPVVFLTVEVTNVQKVTD